MKGRVVWLTGRPASGKTTLARLLVEALTERERPHLWLDSDALRPILVPQAGYDRAARDRFYTALGHLACLGAAGGVTVVVSATAHLRHYRDQVRQSSPNFLEIQLVCPLKVLAERDPKGLYRRAAQGEIAGLPGIDAPYQEASAAELVLDTSSATPEQCLARVMDVLEAV